MNKDEMINNIAAGIGLACTSIELDWKDTQEIAKTLYALGCRKVSEDEIVVKKRQYEQLKKYNRDRKRLRLKWQQAKQETKEILQQAYMYFNADNMLGLPNYLKNERAARVVKGIARSRGIDLEDKNNDDK